MKKIKINWLVILLISIFLLWFALKDNFTTAIKLLFKADVLLIGLSILLYIIYMLLESVVLQKLIQQFNIKYKFKKSVKLTMMSRFFNGITPFSSGGQPLQIYELTKDGLSVTNGTIMTVEHFVIFQLTVVIMALTAITINSIRTVVICEGFLNSLVIIGFVANIGLLLITFFFSISKNLNRKIVIFVVKLLSKVKIIKNKEEKEEKMIKACNDYYVGFKKLVKDKKLVIKLIFVEMLALIVWFMIPLCIFLSLGYKGDLNLVTCVLISIYVFFVGSYIPLPGGSGGIEYAFIGYFSYYVSAEYLSISLVLWRFINYYLPMIIGGIIFNFNFEHKKIKE